MQQSRWQRIREIFEGAVDLDASAREAFVASLRCGRTCASDACCADEGLETAEPEGDPEAAAFQPGDVLAERFVIRRLIGSGGMGEVYEAEDRKLGERVAVKAVRPEFLAERRFRDRFRREIQLARKVAHHNICRIHDILDDSAHPGYVAFTMELVEGPTLAEYIKGKGTLTPTEALPLIRQICDGLAALHREGIVHRDLKPGNVILSNPKAGNPIVKITDFGLARRIAEPDATRSGLTNTRDIVGTPRYMAPEQLTGQPVSPATDIYALGLVIYEMLTGFLPFNAEGLGDNAVQKTTLEPEAPSRLVRGLHSTWDSIILRCLRQEPALRPASADIVASTLSSSPLRAGLLALNRLRFQRVAPRALLRHRNRSAFLAALGMVVVLSSLLAGALVWPEWFGLVPAESAHAVTGVDQRVAVLPFQVVGGTQDIRDIGAGLTDIITKGLSQYEGVNTRLSVVPASEVRRGNVRDPQAAWKLLGAKRSVEGTLEVGKDRLLLILTLVDGEQLRQIETTEIHGEVDRWTELRRGAVQSLATMMGLQYPPQATNDIREPVPGAEAWYLQGASYLQRVTTLSDLQSALGLFERAIKLDDYFTLAHAGLAEACFRMWEQSRDPVWMNKAIDHCRKALSQDRNLPEARITMGMILRGTGKYEESLAEFDEVLRLNPKNSEAFKGKADTYTAMGGHDKEAIATYHRALEMRPADADFYLWLGNFHIKRGNLEDALRSYENVVSMMPDNPKGYTNIAAVYMHQERFEDAIPVLRKAIELDSRNSKAYSNLGTCLFERQDYARAAANYEEAARLNATDHTLMGNLASVYGWLQDSREEATYRRAALLAAQELKLNPKREDLYAILAMYSAGAGERVQARRWLAKAISRNSFSAADLARLSTIHAKLGMNQEALQYARQAMDKGYARQRFSRFLWLQSLLKEPNFPNPAKAG
ncbi:MAG: protein kinase [Bryobacterales bacterium]|nr:protein kinase [Bryobacterales bacterium]